MWFQANPFKLPRCRKHSPEPPVPERRRQSDQPVRDQVVLIQPPGHATVRHLAQIERLAGMPDAGSARIDHRCGQLAPLRWPHQFFCQRFLQQIRAELRLDVELLKAAVLVFEFLHPHDQRRIHTAELAAPLVERRRADAVLTAQLGDRASGLSLLENRQDLDVGEPELLHGNLLGSGCEKIPLLTPANRGDGGGITVTTEEVAQFPYVPWLFSFRELLPVVEALRQLKHTPDLIVCDSQGIAHPRRFALTCHIGVLFDVPAIGCRKTSLLGTHEKVGSERGDAALPLVDNNEIVGCALRTEDDIKPLMFRLVIVFHCRQLAPGYSISAQNIDFQKPQDWRTSM